MPQTSKKPVFDSKQQTTLHHACAQGQCDDALSLIRNGADQSAKDYKGRTPLQLAAAHGQYKLIQAVWKTFPSNHADPVPELKHLQRLQTAAESEQDVAALQVDIAQRQYRNLQAQLNVCQQSLQLMATFDGTSLTIEDAKESTKWFILCTYDSVPADLAALVWEYAAYGLEEGESQRRASCLEKAAYYQICDDVTKPTLPTRTALGLRDAILSSESTQVLSTVMHYIQEGKCDTSQTAINQFFSTTDDAPDSWREQLKRTDPFAAIKKGNYTKLPYVQSCTRQALHPLIRWCNTLSYIKTEYCAPHFWKISQALQNQRKELDRCTRENERRIKELKQQLPKAQEEEKKATAILHEKKTNRKQVKCLLKARQKLVENSRTKLHNLCGRLTNDHDNDDDDNDEPALVDQLRVIVTNKDSSWMQRQDFDGRTGLHLACETGRLLLVKCLLEEKNVTDNIKDKQGHTALQCAFKNSKFDVVHYLLEREPSRMKELECMCTDLKPLADQVENSAAEVTKLEEELCSLLNEQEQLANTLQKLDQHINVTQREIRLAQEEYLSHMSTVQEQLHTRKEDVAHINKNHLTEIRALKMPPTPIRDVLEGVLMVHGISDTSWAGMRKFLSQRGVLQQLLNLNPEDVPPATRKTVQSLVKLKPNSFNAAQVRRASIAAAPLASWVVALLTAGEMYDTCSPLVERSTAMQEQQHEARQNAKTVSVELNNKNQEIKLATLKLEHAKVSCTTSVEEQSHRREQQAFLNTQ
eukprot:TRINITY_DN62394_c0_g1_i1.p1 TRINITY_DN62394_c0_g1~~TRINITY_DN62394_c0_g1_i1.p1  ORF type:complete len:756 (+),score=105.01 TRINITY_DN62394_c0_g1_i1:91-2358(+)